MARSNRIQPSVYFGRPGSVTQLPYPRGDIDKPYERQTYDFLTGSGQHAVSSSPLGSRGLTLVWNGLHVDNFSLIEKYWNGAMGLGPWILIDPSATNLLLPNQASTTNVYYDATNMSTQGVTAGTLLSNTSTSFIHRAGANRSLRWQFTTGPITTRPTLANKPGYRSWFGIPVVVGLPYTYSCWIRADGVVDSSIGINMRLRWMDSTGAVLSDSGNPGFPNYTTVTASWVQLFVTGTAPANAAYVSPSVVVDDTTVTVGSSLYIDEQMFEQDSAVNSWAPGTGIRAVEITSLTEVAPFDARWRKGMSLTLRELAI